MRASPSFFAPTQQLAGTVFTHRTCFALVPAPCICTLQTPAPQEAYDHPQRFDLFDVPSREVSIAISV
jgi:hypothetical protein